MLAAVIVLACSNGTGDSDDQTSASSSTHISKFKINDTGISQCLTTAGALVDCSSAANNLPGQDGDQGQDVTHPNSLDGKLGFRFEKLDKNGQSVPQASSYADNPWSCVKDATTGNYWEVKANESLSLHYFDWVYSWYSSDSSINLGNEGSVDSINNACYQTPCNSEAYIAAVNAENLCGFSDWRLPTIYELMSIRDYGSNADVPSIDSNFFPNDPASVMWTSVNRDIASSEAYAIRFSSKSPTNVVVSGLGFYPKSNEWHIRLVRSDAQLIATTSPLCQVTPNNPSPSPVGQQTPTNRFINNGDGTVQDRVSGLMWKQCAEGQSGANCDETPANQYVSFANVLMTASQSNFANYYDWRVPNIKELASIVEPLCSNPAINQEVFPGVTGHAYWSSSPVIAEPGTLYYVHFADGAQYTKGMMDLPIGQYRYLRLVRNYR